MHAYSCLFLYNLALGDGHLPVIRAVGCLANMTGVVSVEPGRSTAKVTVVPT
jgi:hypothetical protein